MKKKIKASNIDNPESLENCKEIFYKLYYTKGMMEALIEFSGHIQLGNSVMDHFHTSLSSFVSKLYDLCVGTKNPESEYNLGRNIQYLIDNYNNVLWGIYEEPDMTWNCPNDGEIYATPMIKKSCKPDKKDLEDLKHKFDEIKNGGCTKILYTWRNVKYCHTGTTDQLKNDLKPFKYKEAFEILDGLAEIYNEFYFYLTGSKIGFSCLADDGKTYKLTDLLRLELYEGLRDLYYKNKMQEISDEEFLAKIKQMKIF